MNRRDILKKMAIAAPVVLAVPGILIASPQTPTPLMEDDQFMFHGWRMRWRDWMYLGNQDARVAQWIAYGERGAGWHLYSSYPGNCGPFYGGQVFDLARREDQILPTWDTTTEQLLWCKYECLEALKRLIVKVGSPPFDYEKWRGKL
jgi:hypothetical protein